jgi:hypothetical protein
MRRTPEPRAQNSRSLFMESEDHDDYGILLIKDSTPMGRLLAVKLNGLRRCDSPRPDTPRVPIRQWPR